MPHQIIEYSENLESLLDIQGLVQALHQCAAQIDALPLKGLRTRAHPVACYEIADGHPDNAFVAVYLRIGQGRTEALRSEMGELLAQCLVDYTAALFQHHPLALSYEVQEIDPVTRWNFNNLEQYLAERQG